MLFEAKIARQIRKLFLTFNGRNQNKNPGWLYINKDHSDFYVGILKSLKFSSANNRVELELENSLRLIKGRWKPTPTTIIILKAPEVNVLTEKGLSGEVFKIAGVASFAELAGEAAFRTKFPAPFRTISKAVA